MAEEDFGTDICWNASTTTLGVVSGNDNMSQSIINRLQTTYDELDWVYEDYGCNYRDYLGLKTNDESLEFVKNSIRDSLENDDRIGEFDLELSYLGDGVVNVLLNVDGTGLEFNLGE